MGARARSQGAGQTSASTAATDTAQGSADYHRARSRVRFDQDMASLGVQHVRHADVAASPRGTAGSSRADANIAEALRATVATAAARTVEDTAEAKGGQSPRGGPKQPHSSTPTSSGI